jgi:hypothetical protein
MKMVFLRFDAGDTHFYSDDVGVNAINGGTQGFIEHRGHLWAHERDGADGRSLPPSYPEPDWTL